MASDIQTAAIEERKRSWFKDTKTGEVKRYEVVNQSHDSAPGEATGADCHIIGKPYSQLQIFTVVVINSNSGSENSSKAKVKSGRLKKVFASRLRSLILPR
jgi:hypothetical protein